MVLLIAMNIKYGIQAKLLILNLSLNLYKNTYFYHLIFQIEYTRT